MKTVRLALVTLERDRLTRVKVIRGYTLVELMITVAIVGILATLATAGVRRYVAFSKGTEAINALGGIGRAVHIAANRDATAGDVLALGASSELAGSKVVGSSSGKGQGKGQGGGATVTFGTPGLCGDTTPVPSSMTLVKGRKYQPNLSDGMDYETGDVTSGWRCLKFSITVPQYYQYRYTVGGPPITVQLPHGGSPPGISADKSWSAFARGDLNGDGVLSWFILNGYITGTEIHIAPAVDSVDEDE
jgi:prepilin-type N-terminal cleavage/methylation domain-containing protein